MGPGGRLKTEASMSPRTNLGSKGLLSYAGVCVLETSDDIIGHMRRFILRKGQR